MAQTEDVGHSTATSPTKYYDALVKDSENDEVDLEGSSQKFVKFDDSAGDDEVKNSHDESDYKGKGSGVRLRSKMKFDDHFSLPSPSNAIRFEKNDVKVYSMSSGSQIHIEDHGENSLLTRQVSDHSVGLTMLRLWYALISLVMMGLLLVFTVQLLFNIFVSLVLNSGLSASGKGSIFRVIIQLLSLPLWIFGLSAAMSIASAFVVDTWRGNKFIKLLVQTERVWVDWISFLVFLGIPLLTMIIALFAKTHFWKITTMVWVLLAFALYCFYVFAMTYYEVRACFELIRHDPNYKKRGKTTWPWMALASIEFQLNYRLCGVERYHYLQKGHYSPGSSAKGIFETEDGADKGKAKIGLWARFTKMKLWEKCGLVTKLDKPKRRYNIHDVDGGKPVVTSYSWELEKYFLRGNTTQYATIISGPGSLTPQQARSSFLCSIIALLLMFFLVAAIVRFLGDIVWLVLICLAAFLLVTVIPRSMRLYKIAKFYVNANKETDDLEKDDKITGESTAFLEKDEKWEVNKINPKFGWFVFAVDVIFFYLLPLISFFVAKSVPTAVLFLFVGLISLVRYYLNPSHLIQSFGKLDDYMDDPNDNGEDGNWRDHHRAAFILKNVTKGKARDTWRRFFGTFILIFIVLFVAAYIQGVGEGMAVDSLDNSKANYEWPRQKGVTYPTCNLEDAKFEETGLADYTYMAYVSSFEPGAVQDVLDIWFGKNVAESQQDIIDEFKKQASPTDRNAAVTYRLIHFPSNDTSIPDFNVVTIRGTSNIWDMLSDMQLWTAALFVQALRAIVPFGSILDAVYTECIGAMGFLETSDLTDIEFYRTTTKFVKWLRDEKNYTNIHLAGHSLGGGIAMITGAQTETPAYALSGPNAVLGRKTYVPSLDLDAINKWTFNIVPDRDPVPRIDLLAQNSQDIRCMAPLNQPYACHRATRSLCEIMYQCGSEGRPIFCNCVLDYGYPDPNPKPEADMSFRDFCELEKEEKK